MRRLIRSIGLFCVVASTGGLVRAGGSPLATDPTGHHTYFDTLVARPEVWKSYSLRSQAQLNQYVSGPPPSPAITYGNDTDWRRQDAAKVVIAANTSSLTTAAQVRLPIDVGAGATLITWDGWWGREFQTDRGILANGNPGMPTQKTFQISSPLDNSARWLEVRQRFSLVTAPAIGVADVRMYCALGPGVTLDAPLSPQVNTFVTGYETWTRFWVLVEILPNESFDRVSMWVADERRNAVKLFDRLQLDSAGRLNDFWLEYNSSQARIGGPLVGYVRNLAVLRNVADPTSLLQRPWTDPAAPPPPSPPPYTGPPPPPPTTRAPAAPGNVRISG